MWQGTNHLGGQLKLCVFSHEKFWLVFQTPPVTSKVALLISSVAALRGCNCLCTLCVECGGT